MIFRCSNLIMQGGQLTPLLYNVYADDLFPHLQATGLGCYVGGAWIDSLTYADDIVLLAPMATALQTLLEICRAYAVPRDIVYNTTKTVYVCWFDESNPKVCTQQESGSGMRNLAFYTSFVMYRTCHDHRLSR